MAKSKREEETESEEAIMERVKDGFRRLLNTPPETHEEMVRRRRGEDKISPDRKKARAGKRPTR